MAKAATAKKATPAAGHNVLSEREQWEEQQFLNGYRQIKGMESDLAGTKGEIAGIYKRIESCGGWTKADIKWAKELDEKDAPKVLETMRRRLRIARMLGHGVSRQVEMFDEDRTPLEDRAYDEGLAAGKLRKSAQNPYGVDSPAGQAWQRGLNDGTAFINADLASKFGHGDGDELISGDDPDDEDDNGDDEDAEG